VLCSSTSISKFCPGSRQSKLCVLLACEKAVTSHISIVRFDVYCEQVRMEYAFVPLPSYLEKRAKFLSSMAAAPSIYKSAEFKKLEDAARLNCSREATRLLQVSGGGH
jgi:predicted metal-dependent HD superfamily phosphohydrolase